MAAPGPDIPFDQTLTAREFHTRMAKGLFNRTWELLDMGDTRTADQDDEMVHTAHASRYHWSRIGEPVNLVRGDWQLARIYAVLGRPDPALWHAEVCLRRCEEHGIGDFDLAFAHEAIARAAAMAGDGARARRHLDLARAVAEQIADDGDREHTLAEIASIVVPS